MCCCKYCVVLSSAVKIEDNQTYPLKGAART